MELIAVAGGFLVSLGLVIWFALRSFRVLEHIAGEVLANQGELQERFMARSFGEYASFRGKPERAAEAPPPDEPEPETEEHIIVPPPTARLTVYPNANPK
ncbi:MAG TPA: hypothetical protein VM238_18340 [Phycisphaerae bacterium]|nr:hypothetical protein [Phycisphaerae bacterium]